MHALAYDLYPAILAGACALGCAATYAFTSPIEASKPLLMTPKEFFSATILLVVGITSFVATQQYGRRLLQAQLLHVADQLRSEKERLQYDLLFVQRKYTRARYARDKRSDDGSTQSGEDDEMEGQGLRPGSKVSVCSSGMDSIVNAVAELSRLRGDRNATESPDADPDAVAPGQYTNDDRDHALWSTLDMQGIVPH